MKIPSQAIARIGELFQEHSKYQYVTRQSDMVVGVPVPPVQKPVPDDAQPIDLPKLDWPGETSKQDFAELIERRISRRSYSKQPLTLEELSFLLWATQGVKQAARTHTMRTVPSAGARHPLETYLAINRVEGLESGFFRFLHVQHQLIQLNSDATFSHQLAQACLGQDMLETCAVAFIWTAVIERSRWKYQQRGFRYIYLDAGHVCQNLYLTCEAFSMGCCAIAAFDDDAVNELISVDGQDEFAIYLATVGKI